MEPAVGRPEKVESAPGTMPLLFQRYPDLAGKIPWLSLGTFPTRVHRLERCGLENLWVKREDESSSLYGGNKIRKLEFALAEALSAGKKKVVTMGGLGTNHGLATAIFCREAGLSCRLLLFDQPVNEHVRRTMLLCNRYGADMVYAGGMLAAGARFFTLEKFFSRGAYFLPAGGSSPTGCMGAVNAAFELERQVREGKLPRPRYIICALGSGGTLAGLALGTKLAGMDTEVLGVLVTVKRAAGYPVATTGTVKKLMKSTLALLHRHSALVPPVKVAAPAIIEGYLGDGYGCDTGECLDAMAFMKEREGIDLDPTYTGKCFAAVRDFVARMPAPGNVLYWHSYNSVDLASGVSGADWTALPKVFHRYFQ
ncbi:MAG TPA: pyridoxal-phosphate dependent enzyme [Spirochaetes bacterium]|nr:pyridoxal-phosphate dependent enzyme [Spirochaetota bacterium]